MPSGLTAAVVPSVGHLGNEFGKSSRLCAAGWRDYCQAMTGAHRHTDPDPVHSRLESVRWLLQGIGLIAACLAIVVAGLAIFGIPTYLIATDSKFAPIAVMALQGIVAVDLARRLVVKVLRNRTPSPKILADWIGDSTLVIAWAAVVLTSFGRIQGWMHGASEYVMLSILGLFAVGMPVYWWRGQQRAVLAPTARAVAGRWPWSAGG